MAAFTAQQRAQIADAIARKRVAADNARAADAAHARMQREQDVVNLACQLIQHISPYSTVDPAKHAISVARTIVKARRCD